MDSLKRRLDVSGCLAQLWHGSSEHTPCCGCPRYGARIDAHTVVATRRRRPWSLLFSAAAGVVCARAANLSPARPRAWSSRTVVTWLILPVVICLSQRLSHACLSISLSTVKPRMAH